jgi:hypothetical protein
VSGVAQGALAREPQPLWLTGVVSVGGHLGVIAFALAMSALGSWCSGPSQPPIRDALEVSVIALPKSKTNVPDKATRAAVKQGTPDPSPKPPEPAPIRESDLAVPKPEPKPGTDEAARRRDEALRQMERERLMEDLAAADGPVDRDATDPNSTSDVGLNVNGRGTTKADPEYVAWVAKVQKLMMASFHPLSAITSKNPGIKTRVILQVDPTSGRIQSRKVQTSSGVPAYDAAATRAVDDVGTIPLPPDAWLPLLADGLAIDFTPP